MKILEELSFFNRLRLTLSTYKLRVAEDRSRRVLLLQLATRKRRSHGYTTTEVYLTANSIWWHSEHCARWFGKPIPGPYDQDIMEWDSKLFGHHTWI